MKVSFVTIPTTIEPLGIMYLSASLKQAGHECSIGIDGDILAASIMPGSEGILEILEKEKKGRRVIVGGPAPTIGWRQRNNYMAECAIKKYE
jgi:hypothetical protein